MNFTYSVWDNRRDKIPFVHHWHRNGLHHSMVVFSQVQTMLPGKYTSESSIHAEISLPIDIIYLDFDNANSGVYFPVHASMNTLRQTTPHDHWGSVFSATMEPWSQILLLHFQFAHHRSQYLLIVIHWGKWVFFLSCAQKRGETMREYTAQPTTISPQLDNFQRSHEQSMDHCSVYPIFLPISATKASLPSLRTHTSNYPFLH